MISTVRNLIVESINIFIHHPIVSNGEDSVTSSDNDSQPDSCPAQVSDMEEEAATNGMKSVIIWNKA